jgi:hypothetical protein
MRKEIGYYLRFLIGAVFISGPVWLFVLLLRCDSSPVFYMTCQNGAYALPLGCSLIWFLIIGAGVLLSTIADFADYVEHKNDRPKSHSNNRAASSPTR